MTHFDPLLPSSLSTSLARRKAGWEFPHVERFRAALLFLDVSGFTALTEKLQERGRDGAEEISDHLGSILGPAVDRVQALGGSVVGFGGDSLFCLFRGREPVSRAEAAAGDILELVGERGEVVSSVGPVGLGISQAVHYGNVKAYHLGGMRRRHYLVAGEVVEELARLESRAPSGAILVSSSARRKRATERRVSWRKSALMEVERRELQAYLEPGLLSLYQGFEGAYRRVAVLFLETKGGARRRLQEFYGGLVSAAGRYGGLFLKTDLSAFGVKWLVLFGLGRAHEKDLEMAVHAGIELIRGVPAGMRVRGGIHGGIVVNVIMGNERRCSVDVIGDAVNTAARTMVAADWGELWVTDRVKKEVAGLLVEERGEQQVKGKRTALTFYAAKGTLSREARRRPRERPLVGRREELRRLAAFLGLAAEGRGGGWAIGGEAGLGKSRLAREVERLALTMGFDVHAGHAPSFGGGAYELLRGVLRGIFGLPENPDGSLVVERVERRASPVAGFRRRRL